MIRVLIAADHRVIRDGLGRLIDGLADTAKTVPSAGPTVTAEKIARSEAQPSSPRMSSAVRLLENRSPSSMTPRNSAALRRASATTFSSIVSRAIIR